MKILTFAQGSPEWAAHRTRHFNASDAPACLGESPHCTRTELLHRMATGIAPEVDKGTQRRFDDGHAVEALLRTIAEEKLGEPLHPFVGVADFDESLSASFDGCTFMGDTILECKLLNARLRVAFADMETMAPEYREHKAAQCLPIDYRIQMEHQLQVARAERCLFMAGELRSEELGDVYSCWYYPDVELWAHVQAGWKQFASDLAAYVPCAAEPTNPTGRAPESLPALRIELRGEVTASNLADFKANALAVFAGINRTLTTDAEFADAEKTVKWCGDVEERLKAAKEHALSQTTSIDALFKTIDDISAESRRVRLDLDKLVKARKEAIRGEIVAQGIDALRAHIGGLNDRLGKPYMPTVPADFGGVIKNLRTVDSVMNAVKTELARAKIAANETADRIEINMRAIVAAAGQASFPDAATLVLKAPDDLRAVIAQRVAEQDRREQEQRERIRKEEAARLEREQQEKLAAEVRQREEEEARQRRAREAEEAASLQEPSPVLSDAASSLAAGTVIRAAAVIQMQHAAAPASTPTLKLGEIGQRLGFTITADFLTHLGFPPAGKDRSAVLFHEADFSSICAALADHIRLVGHIHMVQQQREAA